MPFAGPADALARRRALALAAAGALVLLTGCSGVSRPLPSATQLPPGIAAQLVGPVEGDEVRVELRNTSEHPLEIVRLRVDDERFAGVAVRADARPDRVGAGRTALIPVRLPAMDCQAPVTSAPRITLAYTLGPSSSVAATGIDDPAGLLDALRAQQCAALAHE